VENLPLKQLIKIAYHVQSDSQFVVAAPNAILTERFDINAKEDEDQYAEIKKMSSKDRNRQRSLMLQSLLAERFHLKVHFETREMPTYALVLAKGGSKLQPSSPELPASGNLPQTSPSPDEVKQKSKRNGVTEEVNPKKAEAAGYDEPLDSLASVLSHQPEMADRPIINKTGLSGKYDWSLHWTPERSTMLHTDGASPADSEINDLPLFTALKEQLGLEIKSQKAEVETIVIDHIEQPEN
jgi:uncharacterized protein (TIGR03435 family)